MTAMRYGQAAGFRPNLALRDPEVLRALRLVFGLTEGTSRADTFDELVTSLRRLLADVNHELGKAKGVVYFIEKDGLVKIGWTSQLKHRLQNLRPDRVLCVLPGTRSTEYALHDLFRDVRTRRGTQTEWFLPDERLSWLVDSVRYVTDHLAELWPEAGDLVDHDQTNADVIDFLTDCYERYVQPDFFETVLPTLRRRLHDLGPAIASVYPPSPMQRDVWDGVADLIDPPISTDVPLGQLTLLRDSIA